MSRMKVAGLFWNSVRAIQYPVPRFEESGFAGLQNSPQNGHPSDIPERLRQTIEIDSRRTSLEFTYSQGLWDRKLLSHHLYKFETKIPPNDSKLESHLVFHTNS
jgi:hypothetical protein